MAANTITLTANLVEALAQAKNGPEWMLDLRQKAWRCFEEMPWPTGSEETWRRTRLTGFKLEDYAPLGEDPVTGELPEAVGKSLAEVESVGSLAVVDGAATRHDLDPALAAAG